MSIKRLPSGRYQARVSGTDGRTLTRVFSSRLEAESQEVDWKKLEREKRIVEHDPKKQTVDQFFLDWFHDIVNEKSQQDQSGWRRTQLQQYRTYVQPLLGKTRLVEVTPQMVKRVLNGVAIRGMSAQLQRHIYVLLRKMFGDAIENRLLIFNPAIRKLRPSIPLKEARHLNLDDVKCLLDWVANRKYGLAIWLQVYLGLRCGELQALRWEDIDLVTGRVTIRRNYVRKQGVFRDYPKGKKQHTHQIPSELLGRLRLERAYSKAGLVVTSPEGSVVPYGRYSKTLKQYCRALGLPVVNTHGLRHSTSELYMSHGATRDDLRQLFSHSDVRTTDRYVHSRGSNLEKVTNVIRLFSEMNTKGEHVSDLGESGVSK